MSGKILIVDDLATNRIILKVKLNAACHETIQAANGTEALALARSEQPKLILLDMMLPDISGIEVCRLLRADPRPQHTPVVILTATNAATSRSHAVLQTLRRSRTRPIALRARAYGRIGFRQNPDSRLRRRRQQCAD